jgi:hypothetical protein
MRKNYGVNEKEYSENRTTCRNDVYTIGDRGFIQNLSQMSIHYRLSIRFDIK